MIFTPHVAKIWILTVGKGPYEKRLETYLMILVF